ncbi:MAG: aldo/keto reductase [Eubacteriaceae bacterium]|nr:aldo/keto reductase [Eubacteriaceae bacterium]
MHKLPLGSSGIITSRLGFGCLGLSYMQHKLSPPQGGKLIIHALEKGISFIDTAQFYETYDHIAYAVKAGYKDFVLCTKSYAYDQKSANEAFSECLRKTGRDYVDIMLLHEMESSENIRGHEAALSFYSRMAQKGYIKAVGISTHSAVCAHSAALHPQLQIIEAVCNSRGLGIINGGREAMEASLTLAKQCGKGVAVIKALGGGNLYKDARECFEYAQGLSQADCIVIGMSSEQEVNENAHFFETGSFSESFGSLGQSPKRLVIEEWCTGCSECISRCASGALSIFEGKAVCETEKCLTCGYCSSACEQMALKIIANKASI